MPTASQKTAFGPGKYRGQLFDNDRLKRFVDGTNAAIAAGVPIPLLKKHAVLDADDKTTMAFATEHGQGSGWITKVFLGDDGAIGWEARDVPDEDAENIEKGTVRFTSPEFREEYKCEKEGVYEGPIIRHFAYTPLPGNPHQGAIETNTLALEENLVTKSFQFAEEEREPLTPEKKAEETKEPPTTEQFGEGVLDESIWEKAKEAVDKSKYPSDDSYYAVVSSVYKRMGGRYASKDSQHAEDKPFEKQDVTPTDATDTKTLENPDAPPITTNQSKRNAAVAILKECGLVLPSDFDGFKDEQSIDLVIAAGNSYLAAKQKADAEAAEVEPDQGNVQEASMPFSERDHVKGTFHGQAGDRDVWNIVKKHGGKFLTRAHHNADYSIPKDKLRDFHVDMDKAGYKQGEHYKLHSSQHEEETVQFSEEELAAMPEKARVAIQAGIKALAEEKEKRIAAEKEAIAFAEREREAKNNAANDSAIRNILATNIPPLLKQTLLLPYSSKAIQFNEGQEQPMYTGEAVAKLIANTLPPALIFKEEDVKQAEAPKAGKEVGRDPDKKPLYSPATEDTYFERDENALPSGHISPERAEELFKTSPLKGQYGSTEPRQAYQDPFVAKVEREKGIGTVAVK
jgi:hypothetical protein